MNRNPHLEWLLAALLLAVAWPALAAPPKDKPPQTRTLSGQVTDRGDTPLSGAVVYLKNTKTLAIKSYISGDKGEYRFTSLAQNVDYEVYAEWQGHRSPTRTLSGFDSRAEAVLNLKVDTNK